jgi:hypothetical protein
MTLPITASYKMLRDGIQYEDLGSRSLRPSGRHQCRMNFGTFRLVRRNVPFARMLWPKPHSDGMLASLLRPLRLVKLSLEV